MSIAEDVVSMHIRFSQLAATNDVRTCTAITTPRRIAVEPMSSSALLLSGMPIIFWLYFRTPPRIVCIQSGDRLLCSITSGDPSSVCSPSHQLDEDVEASSPIKPVSCLCSISSSATKGGLHSIIWHSRSKIQLIC